MTELTSTQLDLIGAYRQASFEAFETHYCDPEYTLLQCEQEELFEQLLETGLTEDEIYELTDDAIDHAVCPF